MDLNKLTMKSQAALQEAQQQATARHHQLIEPEHVLVALLGDAEGVVFPLLHHVGANPAHAASAPSTRRSTRCPRCTRRASRCASRRPPARLLETAGSEAEALTDEYISTEHLLLAMLATPGAKVGRRPARGGPHPRRRAGGARRGARSPRVTSADPEDTFQSLEKYGRDLTEAARAGKLDPVIGRDEEVRRTIQVLSRRTKNNPVLIGEPGVGQDRNRGGPRPAHRRRRRADLAAKTSG